MGRRGSINTPPANKITPCKKTQGNVKLTITDPSKESTSRKITANMVNPATRSSLLTTKHRETWNINDFYQIEKFRGGGAFGKVYQAIRHADKSVVALKIIPQYLTTNEALAREVQALRMLSNPGHEHVCNLYDQHKDERYFYLAMEHISGGELFEYLVNRGPFSERHAANFIKEFAQGLAYIHSKGYVHADLKPENLMMSTDAKNPRVKIVDFGFCVPVKAQNLVFGTVAYLAPEILKNFGKAQQPTPEADMFAVGVIMYTVLTGTHPFDRTNQASDRSIARAIVASIDDSHYLSKFIFDQRTNGLSASSLKLMRNLLQSDPAQRMTSTELEVHPWILGQTAANHAMENSDTKLKRFWQRRFRAAIMNKFHFGMLSSEEKLRAIYKSMDLNGDGQVSFDELKHALKDIFGFQHMLDIFQSVDKNENGVLDYDEFESIMKMQFESNTTGGLNTSVEGDSEVRKSILEKFQRRVSQDLSRDDMKKIFNTIDLNGDGTVDISEIMQVLQAAHGVDGEAISAWVSSIVYAVHYCMFYHLSNSRVLSRLT
jgi:calcium-dependent protein kinase